MTVLFELSLVCLTTHGKQKAVIQVTTFSGHLLVFWPGESHGQKSLVGYSPRGHKELDTTEATEQEKQQVLSTPVIRGN